MSNFDANISCMYGYSKAWIASIGRELREKTMTPDRAAYRLEALAATMDWLWENKDESFSNQEGNTVPGNMQAVSEKFLKECYERRDKK